MPKKAIELGALAVSRLKAPGFHFVGGVAGLALQVAPSGGRSWVLRVRVGGKRRDMGLGGFPDVTLAGAREAARAARAKIRDGKDPIEESRIARQMLALAQTNAVPFKRAAAAYIETHEPGWRNAKHAQQWRNSLDTHAYPLIGEKLVRDIELPEVLSVLEPIWRTKTETASRVRGRIEKVLDWSTIKGYRGGLNPARWKGHLDKVLPAPSKIAKEAHHPALPVDQIGRFMQDLRKHSGNGARALEFGILTAARSGEIRGAMWGEIDMAGALWTVPAERMKMEREHRVPLSAAALDLLAALRKLPGAAGDLPEPAATDLVFPAPRGGALSDGTLNAVIKRMGLTVVQHGFRSTFRDWAAELTNFPRDVAEMALAHAIGDRVEAAYRRGDLFEKRRAMMSKWAAFVSKPETKAKVISMDAAKRA